MPELVVGRPVEPGQRLPLVQQLAEPVDPTAPVVAGRQLLGLHDVLLLGLLGLRAGLGLLGPAGGALIGHLGHQRLQPGGQAIQVADGVRVRHRCPDGSDRGHRVVGGERAGGDPGLQQGDLQIEGVVPSGEEGQRLLGRHVGHLPDGSLAGLGADVDRPVLLDPAEGGRPRAVTHRALSCLIRSPGSYQVLSLRRLVVSLASVFIASFPAGPWQTNCYVVANAARCRVPDPGSGTRCGGRRADLVAEHRLKPVAVVLTHGHLDHMFSVAPLCGGYDATCWIHPDDRHLLADPLRAMGPETGQLLAQLTGGTTTFAEPDDVRELTDGSVLEIAGVSLDALHAPGHTRGSVMYRADYPASGLHGANAEIDQVVFSGDVLFAGSDRPNRPPRW